MTTPDDLRTSVSCAVLERGDPRIRSDFQGVNLAIVHDPEVLVAANDEADAVAAVRYARDAGLTVHVQATGHGGHAPITDGLLLVTSALDTLEIDAESRTARFGAGVRWKAVADAASLHGLMPVTGSAPGVGAVGFLTGGGCGPLARTVGFGSDYARSFRVVTGDGVLRTASVDENPELFRALRGSKAGLGVITEAVVELVPRSAVFGGSTFFSADDAPTVLRGWLGATAGLPESVTTSAAIIRFPPLDLVPEPLRGKTLLSLRFAYVGAEGDSPIDLERDGGALLTTLLAAVAPATPVLGGYGVLPVARLGEIHNDPVDPGPSWGTARLLRDLDDGFADAFLAAFGPGVETPFLAVELRHLGGALRNTPAAGDSVGGRGASFSFFGVGFPDPELFAEVLPAASARVAASFEPWFFEEANANYLGFDADDEVVRSAVPESARAGIDAVRRAVDPDGVIAGLGH